MLIPAGFGLAKYVVRLVDDPDDMIFTMGHEVTLPVSFQAAADQLLENVRTAMPAANWGTNYSVTKVELVVGTNAGGTGPYATFTSTGAPINGTSAGDRPLANTACLVTKQTAAPGRRGRGRIYMPGFIPSANISRAGVIDPAVLTVRQGLLEDWFDKCVVEDVPMVLFHATAPATPTSVTGLRLETLMATQRRRLRP